MKKDITLKIENVSKQYRLGLTGTGTLSHDLNRWWCKIRGKEDPYATVGEVNDRSVEGGDYVWAIKDINIEVKKGEILGIIGKNGAGKSTLLKILSRITGPTAGQITMNGRMASLLEVGTGFHPELTGRENIFLNGAILGMSKREIRSKLNEIVDFSGCAKYIDTPVKRYSSGMRVRLGFAVAAFLEPDILVVDEVLAVGDAEFQKKAIGKMKEISGGGERTVLFVSHNMASIKSLCTRAVVMENGELTFDGSQNDAVNYYLKKNTDIGLKLRFKGNDNIQLTKISIRPSIGEIILISSGFEINVDFLHKIEKKNLAVTFELRNLDDVIVFHHGTWLCDQSDSKIGYYSIKGIVPPNIVNCGHYKFNIIIASSLHEVLYECQDIVSFEIQNETLAGNNSVLPGITRPNIKYSSSYSLNLGL